MDYSWDWGVLLQAVSTGEHTTYLGWLFSGLLNTVLLTVSAYALALVIGTGFGILRTLPSRPAAMLATAYVSVFGGVPLIVQFFIWFFVVPELLPTELGDWFKNLPPYAQFLSVSIFSLGIYTGSRICEQVRAGIQALPRGQFDAGFALGLTRAQTYRYVLLPVTFRTILGPLTSEFLIISKNSAVASTIGLLELSGQARQLVDYTAQPYESFICVTLAYMALNFAILHGMNWIRRQTRLPGLLGD
ncbi:L-glutamate ABC transporter membrane protein /L-aspartate ABC transporter membrane protein [Paraburkholderia sp. BL18I3N2]|uniref:amino acid ABC transporter permease n=1 Tax=Paraburkholderia sp. BL18I3N2 TaxID=1938799 RepID=UPI000D057FAD|nr:amino acid ABC transporter permease [Paraburkholderia sp. BL18I3N2]PRX35903.1 L-glutamate ABC transporter membrane protein /L-aspartate ABC transporter membrane protein [Paraburkholderia sp. BL18I3N2]